MSTWQAQVRSSRGQIFFRDDLGDRIIKMGAENQPRPFFIIEIVDVPDCQNVSDSRGGRCNLSRCRYTNVPYPMRFLAVQKIYFFVYLDSRNKAILKKLSDSLATTT
jgi:hypothetical protein